MAWSLGIPFLAIFYSVRFLQAVIGVLGNMGVMIIVQRMKSKANAHVMMWTLALADLLAVFAGKHNYFTKKYYF